MRPNPCLRRADWRAGKRRRPVWPVYRPLIVQSARLAGNQAKDEPAGLLGSSARPAFTLFRDVLLRHRICSACWWSSSVMAERGGRGKLCRLAGVERPTGIHPFDVLLFAGMHLQRLLVVGRRRG